VQREKYTLQEPYIPFVDRNISRSQRLDIWHGKEMFERFRFFLEGIKQTPEDFIKSTLGLESLDEKMKYVKDELAKKGSGYEVYLYEAHDPVLKALGYHVVRTIVPQLVSLYLNEHMITLGARRLREVPARLGYSPAKDFFPWPHPFP
jgi:ribosomal protein S12 methylthiotransferase accessory factor YcaO